MTDPALTPMASDVSDTSVSRPLLLIDVRGMFKNFETIAMPQEDWLMLLAAMENPQTRKELFNGRNESRRQGRC